MGKEVAAERRGTKGGRVSWRGKRHLRGGREWGRGEGRTAWKWGGGVRGTGQGKGRGDTYQGGRAKRHHLRSGCLEFPVKHSRHEVHDILIKAVELCEAPHRHGELPHAQAAHENGGLCGQGAHLPLL